MVSGYPLYALLNAVPELCLVLEVSDIHDVLSPVPLCEVPDLLHRHELTAVDAVVDDGHTVLFAHSLHFFIVVEAEVVKDKCARLFGDLYEAINERLEGVRLVCLLDRLTDHQLASAIDDCDGSN